MQGAGVSEEAPDDLRHTLGKVHKICREAVAGRWGVVLKRQNLLLRRPSTVHLCNTVTTTFFGVQPVIFRLVLFSRLLSGGLARLGAAATTQNEDGALDQREDAAPEEGDWQRALLRTPAVSPRPSLRSGGEEGTGRHLAFFSVTRSVPTLVRHM